MNDIITSMRIRLEEAHVHGIPEYIEKLKANSHSNNFWDIRIEGEVAIMFSKAGLDVTLRDAPDLALKFNNEQFYAEVKHFIEKEQDRIDNAKMSEPGDVLVPYGDTIPLEGKPGWKQVYNVAKKKIDQYKEHTLNILIIASNSGCIEDVEIPSAINMIDDDVRSGNCPELAKLNGILLITVDWYNVSQKRKVWFYPATYPAIPTDQALCSLLDNIHLG